MREHAAAIASSQALQAHLAARTGSSLSHLIFSVEAEHTLRTAQFLERRRDFGAELPPGVMLLIMDRAPGRKCVSAGIWGGGRGLGVLVTCV